MEIKRIDGTIIGDFKGKTIQEALETAVKEGVSLEGAYLEGANLEGANLEGVNLEGANLREANLTRATLEGAILTRANLKNANLEGVNFCIAELYQADFEEANFRGADLQETDFQGANLKMANLQGANLEGANLEDASLERTNLKNANLLNTNFEGGYLKGIKGITKYRTPELQELLDRPDPITAYKLITAEGYGPYNDGIKYEIGKEVRVGDANTDVRVSCGAGVNVATASWVLRKWRPGYRILIVEFNAADIAAIPIGTDGKFRLHRCKVTEEKCMP